MNNEKMNLSVEEKERILKNVLVEVLNNINNKVYIQAYRQVKNEFIKDTLNTLLNIEYNYSNIKLADIVNNDMTLNIKEIRKIMLNGSSNFNEWSFGGCGRVYTSDLQEAFNKPKWDGTKLLELQARCYFDAYCTVCNLIADALNKCTYE